MQKVYEDDWQFSAELIKIAIEELDIQFFESQRQYFEGYFIGVLATARAVNAITADEKEKLMQLVNTKISPNRITH